LPEFSFPAVMYGIEILPRAFVFGLCLDVDKALPGRFTRDL